MAEINGWISLADPAGAALFAAAGWDSVTLDAQHGFLDERALLTTLLALGAAVPRRYVRLADTAPALVGKALDAGADGVIAPLISSAGDARRLAEAAHYPPHGARSFGPSLAALRSRPRPYLDAAREIEVFAMIETRRGFEEVAQIAAVEGVTGLYVGPNDLALSLGLPPGADREEPEMHGAFKRIIEAAKSHHKRSGIFCSDPRYARRMAEMGFDLVTAAGDAALLSRGASEAASLARG